MNTDDILEEERTRFRQKFLREGADLKRILRDKTTDDDRKLDAIYDTMDELMLSGSFDHIDKILATSKLTSPVFIIAYLTATLPAKNKLDKRKEYFERAKKYCSAEELWGLE